MSFVLHRRISHAEVDFLGEVKVSALLGMLEQAAVEASSAAGYDAARYTQEERVWIIRRTRLQRLRPIGGVDEIEIHTQIADIRRARSLRQYSVRHGNETVAEATTDWIYCNMATGRPVRIPGELASALSGGVQLPSLPRDEVPPAPERPASEWKLTVHPSHLDHVVHVNNGIYANYLEDGAFVLFASADWPFVRMMIHGGALRITSLDCEYFADAQAGDDLTVRSWILEADSFSSSVPPRRAKLQHSIVHANGRELVRACSEWTWRRRPPVLGGVPAEDSASII